MVRRKIRKTRDGRRRPSASSDGSDLVALPQWANNVAADESLGSPPSKIANEAFATIRRVEARHGQRADTLLLNRANDLSSPRWPATFPRRLLPQGWVSQLPASGSASAMPIAARSQRRTGDSMRALPVQCCHCDSRIAPLWRSRRWFVRSWREGPVRFGGLFLWVRRQAWIALADQPRSHLRPFRCRRQLLSPRHI